MLFNLKNNAKIIRIILKNFNFIYRLIYPKLLEDIITTSKEHLIDLLNEMPEILPYAYHDLSEDERKENLYGGVWGQISPEEWER